MTKLSSTGSTLVPTSGASLLGLAAWAAKAGYVLIPALILCVALAEALASVTERGLA